LKSEPNLFPSKLVAFVRFKETRLNEMFAEMRVEHQEWLEKTKKVLGNAV